PANREVIHERRSLMSRLFFRIGRSVGSMVAVVLLLAPWAARAQGNRVLTFKNGCSQTVWIGAVGGFTQNCGANNSCPAGQACLAIRQPPGCFWSLPTPASGTFKLATGASTTVTLAAAAQGTTKWSGNVYGSTGCNGSGQSCQTGPCVGGACQAGVGPVGPTTLAEFTLVTTGPDTYDVSAINGVNLPIEMKPTSGQSFGPAPSGPTGYYFCGGSGSPQASNRHLTGCSWQFNPTVNGSDQSAFLQMVPPGGTACTKNGDCTAPQVCGLAMTVGTTTVNQVCGQQIGWWTADEVCGFTASAYGAPFNCAASVSGQGNNANLYLCNGANSATCYNPSATSTCCGCPKWIINGNTLPATLSCGSSNTTTNPSWSRIAQPWAQFIKQACPTAYSFAYDDATSTFTCVSPGVTTSNPNSV